MLHCSYRFLTQGDFEVEWSSWCPNINLEAGCWLAGQDTSKCGIKILKLLGSAAGCATNSGDRWSKVILRILCYAMHWFMMTWTSNHALNIGKLWTSRLEKNTVEYSGYILGRREAFGIFQHNYNASVWAVLSISEDLTASVFRVLFHISDVYPRFPSIGPAAVLTPTIYPSPAL